ncbi:ComF family protein [Parabacteroides sp. APC149_11_2_Y6]
MRRILNDLLNLFYPRLCLLCKKTLIDGEEQICLHCLSNLSYSHFSAIANNPATQLFAGKIPFIHATAFLLFEKGGHVQQLIHALKYYGNKELGYQLGKIAALEYINKGLFSNVDCLVPIPLHPKKQRKRGYNQAEWIAMGIQSVTNIPINTTAIRRIHSTETQTHKQVYERWKNVQSIFELSEAETLNGKHILLIDDVITTGATIEACINTLLSTPGIQISIFGLAIAHD